MHVILNLASPAVSPSSYNCIKIWFASNRNNCKNAYRNKVSDDKLQVRLWWKECSFHTNGSVSPHLLRHLFIPFMLHRSIAQQYLPFQHFNCNDSVMAMQLFFGKGHNVITSNYLVWCMIGVVVTITSHLFAMKTDPRSALPLSWHALSLGEIWYLGLFSSKQMVHSRPHLLHVYRLSRTHYKHLCWPSNSCLLWIVALLAVAE